MPEPTRPTTVPAEAAWNDRENEWELGAKNAAGKPIGEWKWWLAPTGHLVCHTLFDAQGAMVKATRFHPNGEPSREIDVASGKDVYYRSTAPTTENFAYGTEAANVWRAVKRGGYPISFDHYDRDGKHLNPEVKAVKLKEATTEVDRDAVRARILERGKRFSDGALGDDFAAKVTAMIGDAGATTPLVEAELEALGDGETIFHDGDLALDDLSDLDGLGFARLIVRGDLTVRGSVRLSDDPAQLLIVTGDLRAAHVLTGGGLVVLGNLVVAGCLMGDYNHGSTYVRGDVRATLFYPEEYFFEVGGASELEIAFGNSYRLNENQRPEAMTYNDRTVADVLAQLHPTLREQLDLSVDTYLASPAKAVWQYIDWRSFMRYCASGAPVFATQPGRG